MNILIKGMEMPTDHPLWIVVHSDGTVEVNEVSQSRPVGWRTLRNAAVPVPPHGRLIDADAAVANRNAEMNWCYDLCDLPDYLADCPTIIPAEEGET